MIPGSLRWRAFALLSFAILTGGSFNVQSAEPVLYYIPHTHWEGAVFKTREDYLDLGLAHILEALQLLKKYPDYKFTLDQVAYFRPFIERYPEEAEAFKRFIAEGRLEIVGGMDVMPDMVKPGGELFIRQVLYGKRYCREQLRVDVTVAWLLDTFGHHAQLPQLLRLAGYESFWFCRGVPGRNGPSEFLWQGIDGTSIPAIWLPGFYGLFYGPPHDLPRFTDFFAERYDGLSVHTRSPERVGLAGVDVSEPEPYVPALIGEFNRQTQKPFRIRTSVPSEFARRVALRSDLPVVTNDFSPIFQGTYSSRIELKQMTRELEILLLRAENMSALAHTLGTGVGDSLLERGWEPLLFNQTHDLASGVMTDHVYEDTLQSNEVARRAARQVLDAGFETLTSHIDTRGEGIPVIVFNPLGWKRTDVAQVEIGFGDTGVRSVRLLDAAGEKTPVQLVDVDRQSDGTLTRAMLAFVAKDVPALGYSVYRVLPHAESTAGEEAARAASTDTIENEYYRVAFNAANGSIRSVWSKQLQWEALSGAANVISRQTDKGDLWELYRGLDGGSFVAMTNQQAVPNAESAELSTGTPGPSGTISRGPVISEFRIEHPFAGTGFATRVRLYQGVQRVDIETELTNHQKYVRYQALFPTALEHGRTFQEIPFAALERPDGIEFAAQYWMDQSDGRRGLALLNFGLPGNTTADGTLMLSLMRSHNLGAYGFGGGYEPGMSSESGFEIGRPLKFHYALMPHDGDWRAGQVYRAGFEFNQPLLTHKASRHSGSLPSQWGLIDISRPNIILTACKLGPENSTILRFYEAAGTDTPAVQIRFNRRVQRVDEVNLLEDNGQPVTLSDGAVQMSFHRFEIKTIKLETADAARTN